MLINFWLAAHIGRVWLKVHKGLRAARGQMPDECLLIARGEPVSAGRLRDAEIFAAGAWYRAGMAACSPFVLALTAPFAIPGHLGDDIAAWSTGVAGTLATLFLSQYGYIEIKSWRLTDYLLAAGPGAAEQPLKPGAPGRPHPAGFWLLVVVPAAFCGFAFFGSLQASAGH